MDQLQSNPVVATTSPMPHRHDIFNGVDFSDPATLFQSKGVHRELACAMPVLQRLEGAQKKKMVADKARSPNASPSSPCRRALGLCSSSTLTEEEAKMIRREVSGGMKR